MSEVNTEDSLVRFRYAQKLIDGRDEFANQKVIEPTGQPPEPFMRVTDDIISIRDARHDIRSVYLIPVVVVVSIYFYIKRLGFKFSVSIPWKRDIKSLSGKRTKRRLF